jgi:hypothetical protein
VVVQTCPLLSAELGHEEGALCCFHTGGLHQLGAANVSVCCLMLVVALTPHQQQPNHSAGDSGGLLRSSKRLLLQWKIYCVLGSSGCECCASLCSLALFVVGPSRGIESLGSVCCRLSACRKSRYACRSLLWVSARASLWRVTACTCVCGTCLLFKGAVFGLSSSGVSRLCVCVRSCV